MDCNITCFDRILYYTEELPEDKKKEAQELIDEYSLIDLLDFCTENNCFSKRDAQTLYDFIIVFEDYEGNYWEEDFDKLMDLYEAIGMSERVD